LLPTSPTQPFNVTINAAITNSHKPVSWGARFSFISSVTLVRKSFLGVLEMSANNKLLAAIPVK
jgi:hypothetical protein